MPNTPVTQPTSEPARPPIRFRGRSFMATVLAPIPPVADWFGDLDALNRRAPNFFAGRPVILDLSGLRLNREDLDGLLAELAARNIAVLGIEGAAPSLLDSGTPPALSGGRPAGEVAAPDESAADAPAPAEPQAKETARSLILDAPVRSGQTVLHLEGDVTVLGAVASGAEVIAGGSIHVYGALRGRAIAGAAGNPTARIWCRRFEPELVAIDGLYRAADDLDPAFRGQAVEVRLLEDAIKLNLFERG
ncbi:septum site-determining protein MinC [Methylobacterium sp. PvP062]|jgi:septum site-determining protein MinC|uniref:Probable septum site-determining protein MinC n=3 Tax=Methylobacteriaceae TaxID=119045 RepID=B1LSQ2_METRJ|nr:MULTISPECIES: septum site-determining protein MinC [Methylobacterium]MCX7334311.1 septum site-determining protein MinC [Hyphomicrobiales bacterium]ACB25354.1 septum site-determining protein MinC [Methylobacterium radiotolerans JCM 2831]KTS03351.1 septation inhibitor protein [Methylobacterium radiotolerans]KTS50190.1 septation inhibitor protein [Methylobacterium radiotolerans]MBP2496360.1 septum site-determining protein MinC [Methylobacterium sp. PvP105]